jgi:hypothetical protein
MVCSIAMVDAETFEEESEDGRKGVTTLEHIEDILDAWQAYHVEMRMTEAWQKETAEGLTMGDMVPREYHEYLHVFRARDNWGLLPHRCHDHQIPLPEGKALPFKPIRALDEKRLQALREYLEMNLEWGCIHNSTSLAGAPIHFIQKKDASLSVCVNYRGLNALMVKDRMPLPLISEALDGLAKAKLYTKLDIEDAYHNLRIAEGDKWKWRSTPSMACMNTW